MMQAMQSSAVSIVEDPSLRRDLISQNRQPTRNQVHIKVSLLNFHQSMKIKVMDKKHSADKFFYLFLAAWAIMIFMPEAVH